MLYPSSLPTFELIYFCYCEEIDIYDYKTIDCLYLGLYSRIYTKKKSKNNKPKTPFSHFFSL